MKITITRTGGFTGIPLKKTIDTTSLPQVQKGEIEDLLTNVIQKPSTSLRQENLSQSSIINNQSSISHPDEFCYTISVENGEKEQSVTFSESQLSDPLKKVIKLLK